MNKHTILAALANVDVYSQLSCLGSMQYVVTSEAIRQAIKIIPDHPTPETMEAFLNEERNLKLDVEYAGRDEHGELVGATTVNDVSTTPGNYYEERRALAALLDLRQTFLDASDELGASIGGEQLEERTLFNTLQFMATQKKANPAYYARQYTQNMRLGMKNYGQTRPQYVEQEMLRAARDAEVFAAKGEHAVQFLEGLDPIEGPLDERLMDNLAKRCVAKLIARRIKIGQSLSWRTDPEQRSEAEADILFIETAIVDLDGEVPVEAATPPEVDADGVTEAPVAGGELMQQFIAFVASQQKQDPKAPGPVTITKH
jgi:hypothetical protein